jgi:farnesyl diphosphate synthase
MSLRAWMEHWQQRVDTALDRWLPDPKTNPATLHEAMRYSVFNGGKRVRPVLVYAAGQAMGVDEAVLDSPACAVELTHAYSLVHDDLPAMDNDDLRRGQPTCHKAFGDAMAILAGDALQTLAFYALSHGLPDSVPSSHRLEIIDLLAVASGSRGMAGGQAMDLAAVGKELSVAELEDMHIHKTGALIRASVKMGALCSQDHDDNRIGKLDHYAKCIGLAFQIQDDILDVTADTQTLGKTQGADLARDKPTYPALLGLEGARELATELTNDALNTLKGFDERAEPLRALGRYIIERTH